MLEEPESSLLYLFPILSAFPARRAPVPVAVLRCVGCAEKIRRVCKVTEQNSND